jgi:hypothetical protein
METATRSFLVIVKPAAGTVVVAVIKSAAWLLVAIVVETAARTILIIKLTAWTIIVVIETATGSLFIVVKPTAGTLFVVVAAFTSRLVAKLSFSSLSFLVTVTVRNSEGLVLQEFFFSLCRLPGTRALTSVSLFCHSMFLLNGRQK